MDTNNERRSSVINSSQTPAYVIIQLRPSDDVFSLFKLLIQEGYRDVSFHNKLPEVFLNHKNANKESLQDVSTQTDYKIHQATTLELPLNGTKYFQNQEPDPIQQDCSRNNNHFMTADPVENTQQRIFNNTTKSTIFPINPNFSAAAAVAAANFYSDLFPSLPFAYPNPFFGSTSGSMPILPNLTGSSSSLLSINGNGYHHNPKLNNNMDARSLPEHNKRSGNTMSNVVPISATTNNTTGFGAFSGTCTSNTGTLLTHNNNSNLSSPLAAHLQMLPNFNDFANRLLLTPSSINSVLPMMTPLSALECSLVNFPHSLNKRNMDQHQQRDTVKQEEEEQLINNEPIYSNISPVCSNHSQESISANSLNSEIADNSQRLDAPIVTGTDNNSSNNTVLVRPRGRVYHNNTNDDPTTIEERYAMCQLCHNRIMCSRVSNLSNHVRRHAAQKQFQCCYCDYTHNEMAKVRLHMLHNHKDKDSQPIDNICPEMRQSWKILMEKCFPEHSKRNNNNQTDDIINTKQSIDSCEDEINNEGVSNLTMDLKENAENCTVKHESDNTEEGSATKYFKIVERPSLEHEDFALDSFTALECETKLPSECNSITNSEDGQTDKSPSSPSTVTTSSVQDGSTNQQSSNQIQFIRCCECQELINVKSRHGHVRKMHLPTQPFVCSICGFEHIDQSKVNLHIHLKHQDSTIKERRILTRNIDRYVDLLVKTCFGSSRQDKLASIVDGIHQRRESQSRNSTPESGTVSSTSFSDQEIILGHDIIRNQNEQLN